MSTSSTQTSGSVAGIIREFPRTVARGIGQVMFQDSAWTGLLFLIGIFWGAYASHTPLVAWGALLGVSVSTLTGYLSGLKEDPGAQGLWGFNGVLVGCAFPTFLGNTVWMWLALIFCAAMTTWVRNAFNNITEKWGVSSFTFPFVFCTWVFLLAARELHGVPTPDMSTPALTEHVVPALNMGFGDLVIYWLKGIAQVFLIDNWVTGICFLVGLALCSMRAAIWAAIASAIALFLAIVFQASGADVAAGLYGFSAVLTGIALGATFCRFTWQTAIWSVCGIIATFFIQAGMNAFFAPLGLATLTGPFCIGTWLFLIPAYKWFEPVQK